MFLNCRGIYAGVFFFISNHNSALGIFIKTWKHFFYPELWISISSLVIMFLQRISRVGASLYYATARLRCLNMNILINNAFMHKFIQILGVNAYFKSYYMQNESWNTLTGLFILLVPGWTPFCLQNCLNSSWHRFNKVLKHSSEILVHIDMIASRSCCRFVGCTSMMRISRSTTSQRCSIGLRSGDCGGHLSKVNSLSCSRNQSEMIWALWYCALSCWK